MDPSLYVEIINCVGNFIGPPICKYWNYHRKLKEGLNVLRSKKEDLNSRKEDIKLRLSNELHFGKQQKKEVENWLKKVEKITGEIQSLEDEVGKVKYLSRAFLGKRVYEKIEETTEVYNEGSFSESLVIDAPSNGGMALPTPELVGEASVKEKIWEYLMGDSVCKIGVCGMGGIGKTTIMEHIHNELLREAKFDKVIWVTVSQEFDVFKLQKEIASALSEDLSKYEDKTIRAAILSKMILESEKRYVLILDDVWKRFFLKDVGIPEPSVSNGCKLVLTTRSIELALFMGCQAIRVTPLSDGDALNLFLKHSGRDVYVPTLESTLKEVLKQCAGLPLAIIIIGSSMRGENDVRMWKNALSRLKKNAGSAEGMADEVFQRLKFSYDRLPSAKLKHCFLYCALYPEGFEISKEELIEYWIVEGLLDEMETRQEMYNEGFSILKRLENNCLIESVKREGCVKMHDLVRDLALHITSESPRYLVKAGMQLEELPNEQEWKEDVEKVSLMHNRIKEISSDVTIPKCKALKTLLLQNNCDLERIHESFFTLMTGLTILDLSGNWKIKALPNSVSELQNLNALLLHDCGSLVYVPSLSKIRGLKKLDLGDARIKEVPHGIEMLVHLRYLDLNSRSLREVPAGILPKLSRLQHLRLGRTLDVTVEEVAGLRKLETLQIQFNKLEDYRFYLSRLQPGCLNSYYFHVGYDFGGFNGFYRYKKCVGFYRLSGVSIILPTDIQEVFFKECHDIRSLSDLNSSFKYATNLRYCSIIDCKGIECLDTVSSSSCYHILQSIEILDLINLDNFSVLFRGERDRSAASTPTPPDMFSHLKHIEMRVCPKIEKLFWPELVHNLQNLEQIHVYKCKQLAEIISTSDDDEENKEEGKDFTIFTLPKLREMSFQEVPQLKCICNRGSLMECNSLEKIKIGDCPKLKRIPLLLPQPDNGLLLPPVSLRKIEINSKKWWDSLEWDHPNIEKVLKPYVYTPTCIVL
ncbi:hypothetical protein LWI29_028128 [Acer saccharum]|uniref:NB-ARC domain-containing protein n=1 Tax=Acer saccharum TaxID=4024 RepID=A0AA39W471_ACESA|nr:hypothetical protein LWI29_028128 [Acer saccharum]